MRTVVSRLVQQRNATKNDAAANAAAVITLAADPEEIHVLDQIDYSFNGGTPGDGTTLDVTIGGVKVFEVDVKETRRNTIRFQPGGLHANTKNQALVVTLAAGGLGITGKLNILYR